MKHKSYISVFIIFTIIIQLFCISGAFASEIGDETEYVKLGTTNDAGDNCYFNNHYCYTSTDPKYANFKAVPKTNYIECYRLDYTNPKRKDYIYLEKTDPDNDCYFDVECNRYSYTRYQKKTYKHFLVQGDFKTTLLGCEVQMFLFRDSTGTSNVNYISAYLLADGSLKLSNGTVIPDVAKVNTWFNLKVAVNLVTHRAEIYVNDVSVGVMPFTANINTINMVRLSLLRGTGNIYTDNFSVTGLEVPYENGVETKSDVFPDNPQLAEFMEGKVGFHGYGKLMYKDGVKTKISPEPVYDKDKQELYVSADTLNSAFGLSLTESGNTISGSGFEINESGRIAYKGSVTAFKNGMVTVKDRLFLPVTDFAKLLGKYAFTHETGVIVVSDENEFVDTTDWNYVTFRPDQTAITMLEDIDFLSNMLSFEQPDSNRLEADFASVSGNYEEAHPRVLLNQDGFDRLRNLYYTDETYKMMADKVIAKANSYLMVEPQKYVFDDAMRMYSTGARTQNYFMYWGYAYKITGNEKYVRRAVEELKSLDKFPDFNPMHIIDTGMFCMGLACAYDWFYEVYTPEERELAKRVTFEKCYKPLSDAYYGRLSQATSGNGTAKWTSNYNAVVSGGCLNAAIATIECDPEYNLDVIDNCIRSLEYTLAGLMPGGGWGESLSYWNYTMEFLSYSMSSLNTTFGTDYGISKSQGMESTLQFAMSGLGIGGMYNYHDSGSGVASHTNSYKCFMYLANLYGEKTAYGMRMYDIVNNRVSPVPEDVLFYSDGVDDFDSLYDNEKTDIKIDGTEMFTVRDTFNRDKSKFYFATHFGATWGYHHHCDCGSFVLDIDGTRFADDLGADDYNLENELKYSSYELYRKRGEGHNILVIDPMSHSGGFEQELREFAPITAYKTSNSKAYVIADMSDVYAESNNMKQGYYVDKEKMSVTMRNEFEVVPGTEVYWFMHTRADIQTDGKKAYLTRDGKTVCVSFDTNAQNAQIIKMKAEPLPYSPQVPEQNPNASYNKIAIRMDSTDSNYLTVNICPAENEAEIIKAPLVTWSLDMNEAANTQSVAERNDFSSFEFASGSEVKGVFGSSGQNSALRVNASTDVQTVCADTFTPENRYTVVRFNGTAYKSEFALCDPEGTNLIEGAELKRDVWNSIWAIYDKEEEKVLIAVNGVYGEWKNTEFKTGNIVLTVRGTEADSEAYIDNYSVYTSSVIPDIGYTYIDGCVIDGKYIVSDGSLTPGMIISNGDLRVYRSADMTEQTEADEAIGEGAVVVVENRCNYAYYRVTLQKPVSSPVKYYQFTDSFSSSNCVRCLWSTKPDITGAYGDCIRIRGGEESDSNYYLNFALSVDDVVKRVSMDIYPSDTVKSFRFATNGHQGLSSNILMSSLNPGQWNNVVLIIDPATDTNTLYINGVKSSEATYKMEGNLRLVIYPSTSTLSESDICLDNISIIGEPIPEDYIVTDYNITGNVINGVTGITYGEFCNKFRTSSYKYNYGVYNGNGELYSRSVIDENCVLYMYSGEVFLGTYRFR